MGKTLLTNLKATYMLIFQILVILMGLVLPGYFVAKALTCPWPMSLSVPISILAIFQSVFLCQIVGFPIQVFTVSACLLIISVLSYFFRTQAQSGVLQKPNDVLVGLPKWFLILVCTGFLAFVIIHTVNFLNSPLHHNDSDFRWNRLAQLMLHYEHFRYYPPVTSGDYIIYPYPDGIPLGLPVCMWWCYAAFQRANPSMVLLFILLLGTSILLLTVQLSRIKNAGVPAVWTILCMMSTPLIFQSIFTVTETTLIALGTLGCVLTLSKMEGTQQVRMAILLGLSASVPPLAREYGLIVPVIGFGVLILKRPSTKCLIVYCVTVLLLVAPWYTRSFILSGNPFLSLKIGSLFSVNETHSYYLHVVAATRSILQMSGVEFLKLSLNALYSFAPSLLLGAVALYKMPKLRIYFVPFVLCMTALWIWSTSLASGGYGFAFKVMLPAISLLCALSAIFLGDVLRLKSSVKPSRQMSFAFIICLMLLIKSNGDALGGSGAAAFKQPLQETWRSFTKKKISPLEMYSNFIPILEEDSRRFLNDDAVMHTYIHTNHSERSVSVFSPEVEFLFDPSSTKHACVDRLLSIGIGLLLDIPWKDYCDAERAEQLSLYFEDFPRVKVGDREVILLPQSISSQGKM